MQIESRYPTHCQYPFRKKIGFPINNQIQSQEVLLIENNGPNKIKKYDAIQKAQSLGLNLIQIAPPSQNNPLPICKIVDIGKFLYEKEKNKEKKRRTQVKEINFHINTGENDILTKISHIKRLLQERNSIKINLILRGREKSHADLAKEFLQEKIVNRIVEETKINSLQTPNNNSKPPKPLKFSELKESNGRITIQIFPIF